MQMICNNVLLDLGGKAFESQKEKHFEGKPPKMGSSFFECIKSSAVG